MPTLFYAVTVLLLLMTISINSFDLDNSVIGKPSVHCGIDSIVVAIDTEKKFQGRLYVQGESEQDACLRSGSHSDEATTFDLPIGACNMRRQRSLHPRGVSFSFTLVVSFHPLFVTGHDRAFNVRCFFLESVKSLNTNIDVGVLTTEMVEEEFPLPSCVYQLRDSLDDSILSFAHVGQKVTHQWKCDHEVSWVYGHLIHSCYADDGHGNKFELVDDKGCSTDPSLLPQIQYDPSSITAYTHASVFKYADKVQLFFTCTVQLCYKHDGGCDGVTPPVCGPALPSGLFEGAKTPIDHPPFPIVPNNTPFANLIGKDGVPKMPDFVAPPVGDFKPPTPDFVPVVPELGPPKEFMGTVEEDSHEEPVHKERPFFGPMPGQGPTEQEKEENRFKEASYKDSPLNETADLEDLQRPSDLRRTNVMFTDAAPESVVTISPGVGIASTVPVRTTTAPIWPIEDFEKEKQESWASSTTHTTKKRRDLPIMETDLSVDMIVLPPPVEDHSRQKTKTSNAPYFSTGQANICISKIATGVVAIASLLSLIVCSTITYVFAKRNTRHASKMLSVDAYQ